MSPEDIRFEVRRFLYGRPSASLDLAAIRHGMARQGYDIPESDLAAALLFLMGLTPAQVMGLTQELGGSKRYQITSAGVLAYERNI